MFSYFNGKRSLKESFDLLECALDTDETTEKEIYDFIEYLKYLEKYAYLKLEKGILNDCLKSTCHAYN